MKFGATIFLTDRAIPVTELAQALEAQGFDSLWLPEHTHIPTSRLSPFPGGGELPEHYKRTLDPFVALAAAAVVTSKLELATGVCLVAQRDPIVLAKEVASIDHLSGGRFLFGVGGGWNEDELASHGTAYPTRWRLMRERIEAMKEIWANDEASYHGEMVDVGPMWSWPKPVRMPHPPIVVGGNGPNTLKRVVAYGDEWLPIPGRGASIEERIGELQGLAAEAGRGPIPVGLFLAPTDRAEIERLAEAGVSRFVFGLPPAGADEVLPRIEKLAALVESLR